ncbi:MAG TPA: hypothetical protein VNM92_04445 [Thermoanaerobaculia bacterium]|nr:hypothetical protein [Thermoanaerobaculia bacterium]
MKDGKRPKKESATVDKKASGSKKSLEASSKSGSRQVKSSGEQPPAKGSGKKQREGAAQEGASSTKAAKGNGRSKEAAIESGALTFTNPVVEAAFNRALKKYATALKHLTD